MKAKEMKQTDPRLQALLSRRKDALAKGAVSKAAGIQRSIETLKQGYKG